MTAFLAAIGPLSPKEAEAATGLSWLSVANYRKGEWQYLTARVQRVMRGFLERKRPPDATPGFDEGYRTAVEEIDAKLAEMRTSLSVPAPTADELAGRAEGSRPTEDSERKTG